MVAAVIGNTVEEIVRGLQLAGVSDKSEPEKVAELAEPTPGKIRLLNVVRDGILDLAQRHPEDDDLAITALILYRAMLVKAAGKKNRKVGLHVFSDDLATLYWELPVWKIVPVLIRARCWVIAQVIDDKTSSIEDRLRFLSEVLTPTMGTPEYRYTQEVLAIVITPTIRPWLQKEFDWVEKAQGAEEVISIIMGWLTTEKSISVQISGNLFEQLSFYRKLIGAQKVREIRAELRTGTI